MKEPSPGQPRPLGVFWARGHQGMCTEESHPIRKHTITRPKVGKPGETEDVEVWVCVVCSGGEPE